MTKKKMPKYSAKTTKALRDDFRNFLFVIWKYLRLPRPTKRQYEVAYFLQHSESKRRIIEAYRGFGKSWITSAYALWKLYRNRDEKILVISASRDRAIKFTTFCQRLIMDVPVLKEMTPPAWMRWSATSFDVNGALPSHSPSIQAAGVFSQITGARATEIILDDVETKDTVETEVLRAKLFSTLPEMENIVVPGGYITYLGTPHTLDSIYSENKLLSMGYTAYVVPARYPSFEDLDWYGDKLAPEIKQELLDNHELEGHATDPEHFDDDELRDKELFGGKSNFHLQFMLNTSSSDELKYPLKIRDLIVYDTDPLKAPATIRHSNDKEFKLHDYRGLGVGGKDAAYRPSRVDTVLLPYQGVFMSIDPSGRGTDQTAYAVIGQLHGRLYLLALGGLDGGYSEEVLLKLAKVAREYKVNKIVIESNFGDGLFTQLFTPVLRRFHPAEIEEVRHHKQKELRIISTLEPVLNQHRLVIDSDILKQEYLLYNDGVNRQYSLLYQLTMLSADKDSLKHDDKIDALAIAVKTWQEALGLDEEMMKEEYKQEQIERILDNFLAVVEGIYDTGVELYSDDIRDRFGGD